MDTLHSLVVTLYTNVNHKSYRAFLICEPTCGGTLCDVFILVVLGGRQVGRDGELLPSHQDSSTREQ